VPSVRLLTNTSASNEQGQNTSHPPDIVILQRNNYLHVAEIRSPRGPFSQTMEVRRPHCPPPLQPTMRMLGIVGSERL
jgi:hypothetical protein